MHNIGEQGSRMEGSYIMCQERGRDYNNAISTQLIQPWYMKHAFQDFRDSWRCFAKTNKKKKSAYESQADLARSMNLQRASARASSTRSDIHLPSLGCTETTHWMLKTVTTLYTNTKCGTRDPRLSTKLKSLIRSSGCDRTEDTISSSSLADLIPTVCVDFDIGNMAMSPDSDNQLTGEPPSRRSSDAFLPSLQVWDSNGLATGSNPKSPYRTGRHQRRKRSIFRAAKVALTGGRSRNAANPTSSGIGVGRGRYSLMVGPRSPTSRMIEKPHPSSPKTRTASLEKNSSRGTTVTMDTTSSPTCKSSTTTSWQENYDILTEALSTSTSSWSLPTDSPLRETKHDSPCPPGSPREANIGTEPEWITALHEEDHNKQDYYFDDCREPGSPVVTFPTSGRDIQMRRASAIKGVRHTGKDFQEAIVEIILDNDVNDLNDLEEFLQGYFRLNTLYQDLVQQFFNDLSDDLVNAKVSRAPSVFARLAAANRKSFAARKGGGRSRELLTSNF